MTLFDKKIHFSYLLFFAKHSWFLVLKIIPIFSKMLFTKSMKENNYIQAHDGGMDLIHEEIYFYI
jgi:hypothetical protein